MPNNFIPIATQTLSSAASSISFNSIASTYTHLLIKAKVRVNSGFTQGFSLIRFNGVSTSTYRTQGAYIRGTTDAIDNNPSGSPVSSGFFDSTGSGATGDPWTHLEIWIPNYKATTTTRKTAVVKSNISQAGGNQGTFMGAFCNTSLDSTAITSVSLIGASSSNFAIGSTATLYGYTVEASNLTKILTQTVLTTGTSFSVPATTSVIEVLCVGGGGGGGGGASGSYGGGGGGGGGLTYNSALTVTPSSTIAYSVGAGGVGGRVSVTTPTSGGDTNFGTVIAKGGGNGGQSGIAAGNGGSGGGASGATSNVAGTGVAGSGGTSYQNSGGIANLDYYRGGGGGGGAAFAGGAGTTGSGGKAGDGGQGHATYGGYYGAGGGGGMDFGTGIGSGGYLGGGDGGLSSSPAGKAGTNYGAGGGGSATAAATGGAGYTGVIILRYGA